MSDQNDFNRKDGRDIEADEMQRLILEDTRILNTNAPKKLNENEKIEEVSNSGSYRSNNEKIGNESDESDMKDIDKILRTIPLTGDTTCGFWIFKGSFIQRFANKKAYVILYGIAGCIFSMTFAYFNGTITTIEKRYKIPSRNTGIITVGYDISQIFVSAFLSYLAGRGHRPRWIGFGLLTLVIFCLMNALPHFLYGSGEDALQLTNEYGGIVDANITFDIITREKSKLLCRLSSNGTGTECQSTEINLVPQVILFVAQLISGIGGTLYYTLGVSYMDDNTKRSKTPALLSLSYFMRMIGPAIGYALASFCLRMYISPTLTPIITNDDPRWLGAWWLGWILLTVLLGVSGVLLSMFPKELPRAAARKVLEKEKQKKKDVVNEEVEPELPASFKDMIKTFKKLISNETFMCNNVSTIFYFFGYVPYWIFTPKYIEIQYRQSAATSSLVTGTVALAFSAIGILLSGFVITKYTPRARYLAAWNVVCGFLSVLGMLSYVFLGCTENESSMVINIPDIQNMNPTCNSDCQCDYVRYSPVCAESGNTYISPCHAGCKEQYVSPEGSKIFHDCACSSILNATAASPAYEHWAILSNISITTNFSLLNKNSSSSVFNEDIFYGGKVIPGACPVNCFKQFVMFLSVMCFLQFIGATGRASNFLVSIRCVPEKDKTVSIGFSLMMQNLMAFIPSPIFFGYMFDKLCLVWGKTCTNKGNCWLYDAKALRFYMNIIACIFVTVGTLFDVAVWYYVKDLKVFDEEVNEQELKESERDEEDTIEKKAEI